MCKVKAPNMGAFRNKPGVHEGLPVVRGAELGVIRSGRDEIAVRSRCDGVVDTICVDDGEVFTDDLLYIVLDPGPIVPGRSPDAMPIVEAAPMRAGAARGKPLPATASPATASAATVSATSAAPVSTTVFIAASGGRYHRAGCTHLGRGTRAVAVGEVAATHMPCSRCNASDA